VSASSTLDPLAAKRERRRKQLLAEYYGKGESGGESGGGGGGGGGDDAPKRHASTSSSSSSVGGGGGGGGGAMSDEAERLNLEGPHFSAGAYCDSLIGKESLAALVKRDASLEHEVARLDGEMKTLVYENYNKFISATDTIKAIKSNVEQLDHEMAALEQRMAAVGERAHRVDAHLKPKRDALLQLDAVHRLLQKLHFFVELPQRLQQCVELHSYAQAVEHYQKSAPILRKYAELASFKSIEEQCAALIKRLHADLRAQLASRDASSAQVAEAVRLLLLLGDERAALSSKFVAWHDAHVNALLKPLERDGVQGAAVRDAAAKLLPALVDMHDKHAAAFGRATADETDAATAWCRATLARYLGVARKALLTLGDAGAVLDGLRAIHVELHKVHTLLPHLALTEKASDFETQTINELVGPVLDGALQRSAALLHATATPPAPAADDEKAAVHAVRAAGNAIGEAATAAIERALGDLAPLFAHSDDDWGALLKRLRPTLATKVQVKLQQLVLSLNLLLIDYYEPPRTAELPKNYANAAHVLKLVHAARFLQLRTAPRCLDALAKLVDAGAKATADKRLDVPTLQSQFARSARALLHRYASLVAQNTTAALIEKAPASTAVGDLLVELWRAALVDIDASGFSATASDDRGGGASATAAAAAATAGGTSSGALPAVQRGGGLFQRRVDAFAEPQFAKPSLVAAIVLRTLKSLIELVRRRAIPTPVPLDAVDKFVSANGLSPEAQDDIKQLSKMVRI
jgi:uncharacterized small protein (DUF1192 family)